MSSRISRLALPAALVAALLALAPSLAQAPLDAQGTARPSGLVGGPAAGGWDVAGLRTPGHARGALVHRPSGAPVILFQAETMRTAPGLPGGVLRGTAQVVAGPLAGQQLVVHGTWRESARGAGTFQAILVHPGDPATGRPPLRVAEVEGGFRDPSGPGRPGGAFRGRWRAL